MMATGNDSMLLVRYMPAIMTAYQIQRDDAWAHGAHAGLIGFNSFIRIQGADVALASCADPARSDRNLAPNYAHRAVVLPSAIELRRGDSFNNQEDSRPLTDQYTC